MRILKLKGKTEEAVMKQIEKEYKENAIVISVQKEAASGAFKWLKSPMTVVTVAIKDESDEIPEEKTMLNPVSKKAAQINEQEDKVKESYEVLMDLKQELGRLHEEIGEIRKSSVGEKKRTAEIEAVNVKERKLLECIKDKLIGLGMKPDVCKVLLDNIESNDSEEVIRQLFDSLENMMTEKQMDEMPQIIFFIGSTGVGKTTTIAKLTAKYVLEEQKKVVLFTSDTYRIAAVEQLKTYADILGVEIEIIYDESELPKYIEKWKHMDHILIDTAGRSHKNEEQVTELQGLMGQVPEKQVFLVLNANTAGKDVKKIVATYEQAEKEFDLIITKMDETDEIGNIVNLGYYANKPTMYLTNGQNVPADIKAFNKQEFIAELLGRLNDE